MRGRETKKSGTSTVIVTPAHGFNRQIQFSCSNLHEGIDCEFEPHSVTRDGAPVTTMLAVTEEAEGNARARKKPGAPIGTWFGGGPGSFASPMKTIFAPALGCELALFAGLWRRRKSAGTGPNNQTATASLTVNINTEK
jgi:hypothetical protein